MAIKNLGSLFIDFEDGLTEDETGTLSLQSTIGASYSNTEYKYGSSSIIFPGSNNNVVFGGDTSLNIGYGDYTVDVWIKRNTVETFDAVFNIGNYLGGSRSEGLLVLLYADSDLIGYFKSNSAGSISVPRTTEWMHFAITRESTTQRIFINGVLVDTVACTADIQSNNNGITLGSYGNTSTQNPFAGLMDNFRIVNDEALWTEDFDLTGAKLRYEDDIKIPTSSIYHTKQTKMRGKASEGFIRPTIAEFFTSKDFVEVDKPVPATGGTIIEKDGYRIHTFIEDGVFEVKSGTTTIEYLMAGGGGSFVADSSTYGLGGGGAEVLEASLVSLEVGTFPIVIGQGAPAPVFAILGADGGNTTFNGITCLGGGASNGILGGSSGSGNLGGTTGGDYNGGGGGGAQGNGIDGGETGGNGGAGKVSSISGIEREYGTGGGGASESSTGGIGDPEGGGHGAGPGATAWPGTSTQGTDGLGTGAGARYNTDNLGVRGGHGCVIIRYAV